MTKDGRDLLDAAMSEAALQRAVVDLAVTLGWLWHHTGDSRRSTPGLPDLILVRPPRVLFVELKSAKGRPRPVQLEWLCALADCPGVDAYIWWPGDWSSGVVEAVLRS